MKNTFSRYTMRTQPYRRDLSRSRKKNILTRLWNKIGNVFTSRRPSSLQKKPHRDFRKKMIVFLKFFGILCAIGLLFVMGVFAYFAKDLPEPGKINARTINESTKIYDRTGTILLYDIHGEEKRTLIPQEEIPLVVKQATIALEDRNFYHHPGFDVKGVLNAVISNIFHIGAGRGGSTITQQFVKNSILTDERSMTRKIKELILAVEIELRFSKDEILGMYLNEIPYGSNAYGIEAASQTFFNKHAKDLTLDEATILASLPQAPSRYSPYGSYTDRLKVRQEYALDQMVELGYVSPDAAKAAKETDVFAKLAKNTENIKAPHFVMYVRDYLEEQYGTDFLEKEGLKVITTLDWNKQQIAEKIVHDKALENEQKYKAENAALVAIDPQNGDILTMVGSRDYFDEKIDGQVNVAIRDRQPGSSFKPYAYLYAFKKGYTPETILFDVETNFAVDGAEDYIPQNYDGTFRGPVKMKDALGMSLNIPAVKTLYLANPEEVIVFAKQLGITSLQDPKRYGLSLVLGGGEVKLLDHTAAYAVFANNGIKQEKRAVLSITDKGGANIYTAQTTEGERVIDEKYVAMLSHIISTNKYRAPTFGENNVLRFDDRPVAAKTGTTNQNRDAWVMGYTPDVAVGIWSGNNDNSPMSSYGAGVSASGPIFRDFILQAYSEPSGKEFPKYDKDENKTGKDILDGELPETKKVEVCEIPGKDDAFCLANKYCPNSKKDKILFANIHNILHYVIKDDPRGDEPKDPKSDPQYKNWEKGVKKYYTEKDKNAVFDDVPEDCKKEDFEDLKAEVSLSVPDSVNSDKLTIKVSPKTDYDVEKIEYFVEGEKKVETKDKSYTYSIPSSQNNSSITIEVRLTDTAGNTASAKKSVSVAY
ncbi:MAG: PBP1A family penicillin-binding protein [Parcubacteria group bacterium]|jgi:1A family penicillin-binding protein